MVHPLRFLAIALLVSTAQCADTQPALDLITRQFGSQAASSVQLELGYACPDSTKGCFSLSATSTSVTIKASAMSELTYGIGYYTRFHCGATVGWARGGGSHTLGGKKWPCHVGSLSPTVMSRTVPYTYQVDLVTMVDV